MDVGQRIRQLREQVGLSLRQVAERSGLSLNAISRIERGDNSPTVASLHLIAGALNVAITEFFVTQSDRRIVYMKPEERSNSTHHAMQIESLGSGLRDQQLEPFLVTVLPDNKPASKPITHAGQEFVYCLDGQIHYRINDETFILDKGYSLLFEASQPHYFWNETDSSALLIFVFQAADANHITYQKHLENDT